MNKLTKSLRAYKKCFGADWHKEKIKPRRDMGDSAYYAFLQEAKGSTIRKKGRYGGNCNMNVRLEGNRYV